MSFLKKTWGWITHHKKIVIPVILVAALIIFLLRPKPLPEPPTQKVTRTNLTESVSVSGTVAASQEADLSFLTTANLTWLGFQPGDIVHKGQAIATVDTFALQKALQTALNNYRSQRNQFDQTQANNANNTLQVQQQTSYAQSGATASTTNSQLNDIVKRILDENQATLDNSVINVDLANNALRLSTLVSPIDGILVAPSQLVNGMTVSPATIFKIIDPSTLVFAMDVDEADAGKISVGQPTHINLDAYSSETLTLPVSKIDFVSHVTSNGGNAFTTDVLLPAASGQHYRIGMNGNGEIVIQQRQNVLSVPLTSVIDEHYVYKKSGKLYKKTRIDTGIQTNTDIEVTSGLSEGDIIVTDPTKLDPTQIAK